MKFQLQAGFILKSLNDILDKKVNQFKGYQDILRNLSYFSVELEKSSPRKEEGIDSVFNVVANLLSRGLPTIPSIYVEDFISTKLEFASKEQNDIGSINFRPNKEISESELRSLFNCFYIIDPRLQDPMGLNQNFDSWEDHSGSEYEEILYKMALPDRFGSSICQVLETQRSIRSILQFSTSDEDSHHQRLGAQGKDFYGQRVDFSLQAPGKSGLVIEVDGSQHEQELQYSLDQKRDSAVESIGWSKTARISTKDIASIPEPFLDQISSVLDNEYFKLIQKNFNEPIWEKDEGLKYLQLTLAPLGVARVQRTLVELIINGILDLKKKKWKIGFLERDIPCAGLAVRDIKEVFDRIYQLIGSNKHLPSIEYSIFSTNEFSDCQLNNDEQLDRYPKAQKDYDLDVLIDISILQRSGLTNIDKEFKSKVRSKNIVIVRSIHSEKSERQIKSSKPIKYNVSDDEQPPALVYFLQNIFRKNDFRPGQVKIIQRALSQDNVIALLPTGAGKSLTYQLSAVLQPGIVMIVDPLVSLMKDQNDNLKSSGMDSTAFINKTIKTPAERQEISERMVSGYYQFVFVSPERLQIPEFRQYLRKMKETIFSYCVVDEAHCVSEWGHDFRTSYLRLGANVREYCNSYDGSVPILGLTGTASFDVLSDVQRELDITDESAIISPDKYEREELNFEIIDVGEPEVAEGDDNDFQLKSLVAKQKQDALHKYLSEINSKDWANARGTNSFEEFLSISSEYSNSGLIFCPHRTNMFGVQGVHSEVISEFDFLKESSGIFFGGDSEGIDFEHVQDQFKRNELNLLAATKAFGMGIDKPNIRFTVHFNMPQSIESFYQEAGRAGRDRKKAYCAILYSKFQIKEKQNEEATTTVDRDLMLSFYYNSFRGIQKEKRIMWELLSEISYPEKRMLDSLSELAIQEDVVLKFSIWSKHSMIRLYVNGEVFPKGYGYIDLRNNSAHAEKRKDHMILPAPEAFVIVEKVLNDILKRCPDDSDLLNWVTKTEKTDAIPGFEKILKKMKVGDPSKQVLVGFRNNNVRLIADLLGFPFDDDMVERSNNYCFSATEFFQNLNREFRKVSNTSDDFAFTKTHYEQIPKLFNGIRDASDTFKAIYRLSVFGVVDDYEVDYRTKTAQVLISKKDDEKHLQMMQDYIGRYVSQEDKNKVPNDVMSFKGDSVIQKSCGYLADFVYDKIASKRFEAINVMESAIRSGLDGGNFEEFINTYFDSKFTTELREILYDYTIETVWDLLDEFEGDQDSLNHLRGACDRLLTENPENAALMLFRAFSRLLIINYNKSDALSDLRKGWKIFIEKEGWSRKESAVKFQKYYDMVKKIDTSVLHYLDNEILIDHVDWLKEFNSNFLKGLPNA